MESTDAVKLPIVYGTSTGTAKEVALRIAREAYSIKHGEPSRHYFAPEVLSMKNVTIEYMVKNWGVIAPGRNRVKVIFIVSTTGQGEFPGDAKKLWAELCRKTNVPEIPIDYVVIGLGDSSYEFYNYPGKKLHRRLQQLSANSELDVCLCDDQHDLGYVGALNPFLEECWKNWFRTEEVVAPRNAEPVARFRLSTSEEGTFKIAEIGEKMIERRRVIRNERVTKADHFQDTRLIAFETEKSDMKFEEGDALQVYPENFTENVVVFFEIFPSLKNQEPFFVNCDPGMGWEAIPIELMQVMGPQPWTWEKVATQLLDLQSIPSVSVFEILRSFTEDPLLKEKLDDFCSPQGLEDFYNYVNRPRRTILEVLLDFSSILPNVPSNYIFDLIPLMRPRAFSIASPPKESHHIEILVAVVEYKTNLKTPRKGTCSYWLAHHCEIGRPVSVYCEKGSLRPPATNVSQTHIIMVGPGTGVAPFRSMIKQHLDEWDKHLFFGCRNKDKDFYFEEEFSKFSTEGKFKLYPAFSRDNLGLKVDYVQDVLLREAEIIKSMFESPLPLYIYVCGRSGDMPKDVYNAFKKILSQMGVLQPDILMRQMLNSGQYQTETY